MCGTDKTPSVNVAGDPHGTAKTNCFMWEAKVLEDLGDDETALGPHLEVKTCDRFRMMNQSLAFTSKWGTSAMLSSPRSSSSSWYHEVNKKEV